MLETKTASSRHRQLLFGQNGYSKINNQNEQAMIMGLKIPQVKKNGVLF